MNDNYNERTVTRDPYAVIMAILHRMETGGNIDSEVSAINNILERLRAGECTGEEAIEEAEALEQSRQDYH